MIYFAHATGTDRLKIGFTAGDPLRRLKELQTGSPYPLDLLAAVEGGEADEARWHKDFAAERTGGEWFAMTPRLMAAVCKAAAAGSAGPDPAGLSATVYDDAGRLQYAGVIRSGTSTTLRIEVYDGVTATASGGRCLVPSGKLSDAPRSACRLFADRDAFLADLAEGLAAIREKFQQKYATPPQE